MKKAYVRLRRNWVHVMLLWPLLFWRPCTLVLTFTRAPRTPGARGSPGAHAPLCGVWCVVYAVADVRGPVLRLPDLPLRETRHQKGKSVCPWPRPAPHGDLPRPSAAAAAAAGWPCSLRPPPRHAAHTGRCTPAWPATPARQARPGQACTRSCPGRRGRVYLARVGTRQARRFWERGPQAAGCMRRLGRRRGARRGCPCPCALESRRGCASRWPLRAALAVVPVVCSRVPQLSTRHLSKSAKGEVEVMGEGVETRSTAQSTLVWAPAARAALQSRLRRGSC